jgi:hypothetical protein
MKVACNKASFKNTATAIQDFTSAQWPSKPPTKLEDRGFESRQRVKF